ncbi:MAG: hypothetical protein M5U26_08350 [Planctomycetota bacterium]|nr:hypothetical protein [Planctomycetota bacterium]
MPHAEPPAPACPLLREATTEQILAELYRRSIALQIGVVILAEGNVGKWLYALKGNDQFQTALCAALIAKQHILDLKMSKDSAIHGHIWLHGE